MVKGVINNKDKTYSGLEHQPYGGGGGGATVYVGPHTRMGYLQIAHSCFTADSQSRLKDASGE